jgi:aspartate aminotransferase-like enzyme
MGWIDAFDVLSQLTALGTVSNQLGKSVNVAAGIETFLKIVTQDQDLTPKEFLK